MQVVAVSSKLEIFSRSATIRSMLTPQQIRGARAMLGMTQADLAARAGLSATALNNIERGASDPRASNLAAIQRALEGAGVLFIAENGEGPGVRLRKATEAKADEE